MAVRTLLNEALVSGRSARRAATLAIAVGVFGAMPHARAGEVTFSVYGGYNKSFNSDVTLKPDRNTPATTYKDVEWDGASFKSPPYWGARAVYWFNAGTGYGLGLDYSHAKVVAKRPPALDAIASHFEFTDGVNITTFDGYYRYKLTDRFTPYVALGVGLTVPSVEVNLRAPFDQTPTHQYEVGGPAVQGKLGVDFKIYDAVSAFGEYKLAYSHNDVSIRNGGREQTDLVTNQFIVGLSYSFTDVRLPFAKN